jgi:phage protein D
MSEDRTIPTPAPVDKPTFTVYSGGEEVTKEYQLQSIVIVKEVNRIASAVLLFYDGDPSQESFKISNSKEFIPGREIEIHAGYHSQEEIIFKGIVISHGLKTRKEKSSLLKVVCRDHAVKLSVGRKNRYFYDVKDSDVIEELAGEAVLDLDIETTRVTHKELVQFYCTSWDFIVSRAEANSKLVITDNGKLSVKKPDLKQDPLLKLTFGGNIINIEAEMDARYQLNSLKACSWNMAKQELSELEADTFSDALPGNISTDELAEVVGLDSFNLCHGGHLSDEELQEWVNAGQLKSKLSKIRGRILIQGFGNILPGNMVEIGGMGDRFNGKAFVSGVRHEINSMNWETNISIGLSPNWL